MQELSFEVDGVTFIKPAPPMGKPSDFFVHGRPRKNSTGITTCPPVARTFPTFDAQTWRQLKEFLPGDDYFQASYTEWIKFQQDQERTLGTSMMPFVPITVQFDAWIDWCKSENRPADVQALCEYANTIFVNAVRRLIDDAKEQTPSSIVAPRYVLLATEVIGQDKANDLSSIYLVGDDFRGETRVPLLENGRMFFEHGLCLASAFAVKHGVSTVRYEKDMSNAWV